MISEIKELLSEFIPFSNIYLKARCNKAIRDSLEYAKNNSDRTKILVQDQGGWLRYLDYPPKYGFEVVKVMTNYGLINLDDLREKSKDAAAIIYENPAGYIADQDTKAIYEICKENNCLVIMDVTGMIAYPDYVINPDADIIIGSFGKGKSVNLGYGGFISFPSEEKMDEDFDVLKSEELKQHILDVKGRMVKLVGKVNEVKSDLGHMNIVHKDKKGINVVVKFDSEEEKNKVIEYCNIHELDYTECPRYIRVMDNAISIEIKRLEF